MLAFDQTDPVKQSTEKEPKPVGRGRGRCAPRKGETKPGVHRAVPDRSTAVHVKAEVDQFCDAGSPDREDTSSRACVKRMGRGRGRRPLKAGETKPGTVSK